MATSTVGRTFWEAHTDKVPHASEAWAATDRGWYYIETGHFGRERVTLGHYLDYPTTARNHEKTIHAVSCVTSTSEHFATVPEAQAWIEAQAFGSRAVDYAGSQLAQFGLYPHQVEDWKKKARTYGWPHCAQCNRLMTPADYMVGTTCTACCRKNHRAVIGGQR